MFFVVTPFMQALLGRLKSKYVTDSFVYFLGNIISQALAFFALSIFTRYLSPEEYGIYNYTNSIMSFLLIFSVLSLNSFVLRHYFELKTAEDQKRLFGTFFLFILGFGILLLFLEFLVIPAFIRSCGIKVPFHPYFSAAIVINFFEIFLVIPLAYYRVRREAWKYLFLTASKAVLTILAGLTLVVLGKMGLMGRYYGALGVGFIFSVISLGLLFKNTRMRIDWTMIKKGLAFSLPLVPSSIASIAMVSLDRIMLERFVSVSELGIYSVGAVLGTALIFVIRSFYQAIEPEIFQSLDYAGFEQRIVRLKNNFLYVLLFVGCLMIVFCKEVVAIMVSKEFYSCYKVIPVMVAASLFKGSEVLVGTTLCAIKKTMYEPLSVVLALIVNFIGNLILIPHFGIMGAAFASLIAFWTLLVLSVFWTNKFITIKWGCGTDSVLILGVCGLSTVLMQIDTGHFLATIVIKSAVFLACGFFISLPVIKKINASNSRLRTDRVSVIPGHGILRGPSETIESHKDTSAVHSSGVLDR